MNGFVYVMKCTFAAHNKPGSGILTLTHTGTDTHRYRQTHTTHTQAYEE